MKRRATTAHVAEGHLNHAMHYAEEASKHHADHHG
jgi:hypothetical protein